jgi:hypothetical protein
VQLFFGECRPNATLSLLNTRALIGCRKTTQLDP